MGRRCPQHNGGPGAKGSTPSGLVVLLDDRYAIGDTVEIEGITGEVTDVGVLSTDLRCGDRQVLVLPNSACEKILNHS